jgi:NAD(P)-dependent dehydrogenase (short-subunit alcohol dehydrogenase family)
MSQVLITGSADGLGKMTAQLLVEQGHRVVLHARNAMRTKEAIAAVPGAETAVTGDLSSISETRAVAEQANRLGRFDVVIHNAAVGYHEKKRIETQDGLPHVFATNTLAPYILTALIERPKRLIYISSGLHRDESGRKHFSRGHAVVENGSHGQMKLTRRILHRRPNSFGRVIFFGG